MDSFDQPTKDYFDTYKPVYSNSRTDAFIDFYREAGVTTLLDIGSGDGEAVQNIANALPLQITISDIAADYLPAETPFTTKVGSVLSSDFAQEIRGFDAVQCVSLLHHLVGSSRQESLVNVETAIANMAQMVRPGGYVLIFEPTWTPAWAMNLAFHIKRIVSKLAPGRVELRRNSVFNFGHPVVSYMSDTRLREMFNRAGLSLIGSNVFGVTKVGPLKCQRMQYFLQQA